MVQIKCNVCKKEFYAKPSQIKNGLGKYCSRECHHVKLKTGKIVSCYICKKQTYKSGKALKGSKSKKYFCSKSCQTKWRNSMVFIGKNHTNWKGGRFTYRNIISRSNVPKVCTICDEKDTRVLLVHHMDVDNKNNKLDNLIWLCHNCHFLVHHYAKEKENINKIISNKNSMSNLKSIEGRVSSSG
ncbi:MAG: HNH endonuclease [Candidatus Moraniibacteriota bacterium]